MNWNSPCILEFYQKGIFWVHNPDILFTCINILFLIFYSCIHKRSYLLSIYSLIVIASVLAKNCFMVSFNWPIICYMINALFAGLTLLLKTPKQFSIALCIICVLLVWMNVSRRPLLRLFIELYKNELSLRLLLRPQVGAFMFRLFLRSDSVICVSYQISIQESPILKGFWHKWNKKKCFRTYWSQWWFPGGSNCQTLLLRVRWG